jgi:two-component system chemotaxis response regulator CheB
VPAEQYGATAAGLTCPDCNGSLFVVPDSKAVRFRCRVGHGWTGEALMASHRRSLEQALWAALRVLEDNQALEDRMAVRASARRRTYAMRDLARRKEERHQLIAVLHRAIEEFDDLSHPPVVEEPADRTVTARPG